MSILNPDGKAVSLRVDADGRLLVAGSGGGSGEGFDPDYITVDSSNASPGVAPDVTTITYTGANVSAVAPDAVISLAAPLVSIGTVDSVINVTDAATIAKVGGPGILLDSVNDEINVAGGVVKDAGDPVDPQDLVTLSYFQDPENQLALVITDTYPVVSEVAMLALPAEKGDIAVRSDISKSFILSSSDPTELGDWIELLSPTAPVSSFNSRTGAVTLTSGDVTSALTYTPFDSAGGIVTGDIGVQTLASGSTGETLFYAGNTSGGIYAYCSSMSTTYNVAGMTGPAGAFYSSGKAIYGSDGNFNIEIVRNGAVAATFSSSGLAVASAITSSATVATALDLVTSFAGATLYKFRNSGAQEVAAYFQNSATGTTATDGMRVGIGSGGDGFLTVAEAQALRLGTSNTTHLTISSGGNVTVDTGNLNVTTGHIGLSVTPSGWVDFKVLESNQGMFVGAYTAGNPTVYLGSNLFFDGGWKYKVTNAASYYQQALGNHLWYSAVSGTAGTAATMVNTLSLDGDGNLAINKVGGGLRIKEGTDARMGSVTLVAGTAVVSTGEVTLNSRIFLTSQVDGGTPGFLRVSVRVDGTSFTILSSNVLDTSTVAWFIVEPA